MAVKLQVYNGGLGAKINGSYYTNGETVDLTAGYPVAISVNGVQGPLNFKAWLSDVGTFANNQSASTTYTPQSTSGAGTLALITQLNSSSNQSWGGYILDSGVSNIQCISGVEGNGSAYSYDWMSGYSVADLVSLWTGIGGVGSDLWQAGIIIHANFSNNGVWWEPFTEAISPDGSTNIEWRSGVGHWNWPAEFMFKVCTGTTSGTATIEAFTPGTRHSQGWSLWWNESTSYPNGFVPSQYTGEWIAEDPTLPNGGRYVLPLFTDSGFSPDWEVGNVWHATMLAPVAWVDAWDYSLWDSGQHIWPQGVSSGYDSFSMNCVNG